MCGVRHAPSNELHAEKANIAIASNVVMLSGLIATQARPPRYEQRGELCAKNVANSDRDQNSRAKRWHGYIEHHAYKAEKCFQRIKSRGRLALGVGYAEVQ